MKDLVVIVTPTIMDGQVVRWYENAATAERGGALISSSRNGTSIHTEHLEQIPDELIAFAKEASRRLRRRENLSELGTHRRVFGREWVEPIVRSTP